MDESTWAQGAQAFFSKIFEHIYDQKAFADAVSAAYTKMYGGQRGPLNIDKVGKLAAAISSSEYASSHMVNLPRLVDRWDIQRFAIRNITVEGPVFEFGVFSGTSINHLARELSPSTPIYGFDSFEGLPENWGDKSEGHFDISGTLPLVPKNVTLVKGWFDDSLPAFLKEHDIRNISLLHIDCDLYSSTRTVFEHLHPAIVPGTIILFDEYMNYPGWQQHEHRAFREYITSRGLRYEYIGLVPQFEQVAARIVG